MYGPPNYISSHGRETDQLGVIPRAINHIFELARGSEVMDFQVHCSFVQIYNENLYDMLRDPAMNIPLTIREDKNEIYVQGLSEYNVKSVSDTLQLLKIAEDNRAIRETHMNQHSSRSHSIFQVFVDFKRMSGEADASGEVSYRAKFNLVDLAGSEKWDLKRDLRDEHIAEMNNINLSLHTLGKCISALAKASKRKQRESVALERSGELDTRSSLSLDLSTLGLGSLSRKPSTAGAQVHVPFRESKLTRLLQDSLGGSAKTFLIATVSPAKVNSEESISTLKFADRAKQVMVRTVINESRPVDYAVVKKLQTELEVLRSLVRRVIGIAGADNVRGHLLGGGGDVSEAERTYLAQALKDAGASGPIISASPMKAAVSKSVTSLTHLQREDQDEHTHSTAEAGSSLEYVMSLEKALNKEQVHAQHLTKKNETLIKELEELKMTNMQLTYPKNQSSHSHSTPIVDNGALNIPDAEVKQVMSAVKLLMKQNEELLGHTEQIQKVMKRFFKFQLEEEDMKAELNRVFDALKEQRSQALASKVNDNFAFLEFSVNASQSRSNSISNAAASSSGNAYGGDDINAQHSVQGSHSKAAKAEAVQRKQAAKHADNTQRSPKAPAAHAPRNLPHLHPSQADHQEDAVQVPSSGHDRHHQHNHNHHSSSDLNQVSPLPLDMNLPRHNSMGSVGLSFRVRGPASNVSDSNGKWVEHAHGQGHEMEEEALREEFKKAKVSLSVYIWLALH